MGGSCVIMFACRALEASWRLSAFPAMIPWYDSYTGGMGDEHRGVGYSYSLGRVGSRLRRALLPPRKLGYAWADRGWGGEVAHTVFPVGPHTSYVLWRSRCVGWYSCSRSTRSRGTGMRDDRAGRGGVGSMNATSTVRSGDISLC